MPRQSEFKWAKSCSGLSQYQHHRSLFSCKNCIFSRGSRQRHVLASWLRTLAWRTVGTSSRNCIEKSLSLIDALWCKLPSKQTQNCHSSKSRDYLQLSKHSWSTMTVCTSSAKRCQETKQWRYWPNSSKLRKYAKRWWIQNLTKSWERFWVAWSWQTRLTDRRKPNIWVLRQWAMSKMSSDVLFINS